MEDRLVPLFSNAANSLNNLFKEGQSEIENSRLRGKKDLYQESLKWMMDSNSGDLKFVRIDELLQILRPSDFQSDFSKPSVNLPKKYKPCTD